MLLREGFQVGKKLVLRLYQEIGLQMRRRKPKRRAQVKLREEIIPVIKPNQVGSMGFVFDELSTGKKLKLLTVVDLYSRESPIIGVRFNFKSIHVVNAPRAYARGIRVD